MKAKILLPVIAVVIAGTAAFGAISTFAQTTTDPQSTIIQKISQKFGLKESEVKTVFDQERTERQTQMKARFEERLNQAVSDGKITADQKKLIQAKHTEIEKERETNREKWQSMTQEERKASKESHKDEMQKWATENGIDMQYLFGGSMGGMRGGFGHMK